jgi:hypothetical protein
VIKNLLGSNEMNHFFMVPAMRMGSKEIVPGTPKPRLRMSSIPMMYTTHINVPIIK